jgi:hypothetical protein
MNDCRNLSPAHNGTIYVVRNRFRQASPISSAVTGKRSMQLNICVCASIQNIPSNAAPSPQKPSCLGLYHFSALTPLPDRLPAWVWATFRPKAARDCQYRPPERPRSTSRGATSMQPQDRQRKPQEQPKTADRGPKGGPISPLEAPRAAQHHPCRKAFQFTSDHPSTIKEKQT